MWLGLLMLLVLSQQDDLIKSLNSQVKQIIQKNRQQQQSQIQQSQQHEKIEDVYFINAQQCQVDKLKTQSLELQEFKIGDSLIVGESLVRLKSDLNIKVDGHVYPEQFIESNLIQFIENVELRCGKDFENCILKDWDNIDMSMVSDLDVIQLEQKDKNFFGNVQFSSDQSDLVQQWKKQQVLDRFSSLKNELIANGQGDLIKGLEQNKNIIDIIQQMEQVLHNIKQQKVANQKTQKESEEKNIEQEVNNILN